MDVNILSRVDSVYPLIDREKSDKNLRAGEVWRPPAAAPQLSPDHHHHHPQTHTRARAHTHSRWDAPVERPPARGAFSWAGPPEKTASGMPGTRLRVWAEGRGHRRSAAKLN